MEYQFQTEGYIKMQVDEKDSKVVKIVLPIIVGFKAVTLLKELLRQKFVPALFISESVI